MELEVAIKHWKNNLDKWKKDRPDLLNTEIVEEIDYDYKAIETVLNHLTKQEKMIQKIHENFCKFDWKNSNGEQVHNQLKELYESIFKNEESE